MDRIQGPGVLVYPKPSSMRAYTAVRFGSETAPDKLSEDAAPVANTPGSPLSKNLAQRMVQKGINVAKWAKKNWFLTLTAIIAGKVGAMFGSTAFIDSNGPGEKSVQVGFLGGTRDEVQPEGGVFKFPVLLTNVKYDTTHRTMREILRPTTLEATPLKELEVVVSYELDPEDNHRSIHRLHTEFLGQFKSNGVTHNPGEQTFYDTQMPLTRRIYDRLVQARISSAVYNIMNTVRGQDAHVSRTLIAHAVMNGYSGTFTNSDGVEQTFKVESVRDQLKKEGILLKGVWIGKIELPDALREARTKGALIPLEKSVANEENELNVKLAEAKAEEAKLEPAKNQEGALGKAAADTLKQKLLKDVATIDAERNTYEAEQDALIAKLRGEEEGKVAGIKAKADADVALEKTRGDAEALKLTSAAKQRSVIILGEAAAQKAGLEGAVLGEYRDLLTKMQLEAGKDAILQIPDTTRIVVLDPKTGLKLNVIQLSPGQSGALQQLQENLFGPAAAPTPKK